MSKKRLLRIITLFFVSSFLFGKQSPDSMWKQKKDFFEDQYICSRAKIAIGLKPSRAKKVNGEIETKSIGEKDPVSAFENQSRHKMVAKYNWDQINAMPYGQLIKVLRENDRNELPSKFTNSTGSIVFYKDEKRMQALYAALKKYGTEYKKDDDQEQNTHIERLIEWTRAGFYLATDKNQLAYLIKEDYLIKNIWPVYNAIFNYKHFGFQGDIQAKFVGNMTYLINNTIIPNPADLETLSNKTLKIYTSNISANIKNRRMVVSSYRIINDIRRRLYIYYLDHYRNAGGIKSTILYDKIKPIYKELTSILKDASLDKVDRDGLLLDNAAYALPHYNIFVSDIEEGRKGLTAVINKQGKWPMSSIWAVRSLTTKVAGISYGGVDSDGNKYDLKEVKKEVAAKLLPKRKTYDNGSVKVIFGGNIPDEKIDRLYWASKEVTSQFHRLVRNRQVIDPKNADSTLTMVIYNSPAEYEFNSFLNGLGTDNGGIYIERTGTFYTYERTTAQSIYTLEDLFRHEFTHYLQGRFITPGLFAEQKIYKNPGMTWMTEGQAEFFAGATRTNNIQNRKVMARRIHTNVADRMSIKQLFASGYSSGFTFYRYGYAFWHYIYKDRKDIAFKLIELVKKDDDTEFKSYTQSIVNDAAINAAYNKHLQFLVDNAGKFSNTSTSDDYMVNFFKQKNAELLKDITSKSGITNASISHKTSAAHALFTISGKISGTSSNDDAKDWVTINSSLNTMLNSIDDLAWKGYKTVNAHITSYQRNATGYTADIEFVGKNGLTEAPSLFISQEEEPNDVQGQANGPVGLKQKVSAHLKDDYDNDYFFIDFQETGKYEIQTESQKEINGTWILYDSSGNEITYGRTYRDPKTGNFDTKKRIAQFDIKTNGKYFILVYGYDGKANPYNLLVTKVGNTQASKLLSEIPKEFKVHNAYPNPFNPSTTIGFDLVKASKVTITIYNALGQRVAELLNNRFPAGYHSARWNGLNQNGIKAPSGIYFVRTQSKYFNKVQKIVLIK